MDIGRTRQTFINKGCLVREGCPSVKVWLLKVDDLYVAVECFEAS